MQAVAAAQQIGKTNMDAWSTTKKVPIKPTISEKYSYLHTFSLLARYPGENSVDGYKLGCSLESHRVLMTHEKVGLLYTQIQELSQLTKKPEFLSWTSCWRVKPL